MRVLVVEDEPTAQRVIKMFLERSGYEPVLFDDGQKAFELASSADSPGAVSWARPASAQQASERNANSLIALTLWYRIVMISIVSSTMC